MATAAEVVERAAYRLGELGEGQTISAYVAADLLTAYAEQYAQLNAKDIAVWDYDEEVPDEYVPHVVAMVAFSRAADYSVGSERYLRLKAESDAAVPNIRELQTSDAVVTPEPDYF